MSGEFESMETPELELHNLRNAFEEHVAEIARLENIVRATEVERDASDKVCENLKAEIARLKKVIEHTAQMLESNEGLKWYAGQIRQRAEEEK